MVRSIVIFDRVFCWAAEDLVASRRTGHFDGDRPVDGRVGVRLDQKAARIPPYVRLGTGSGDANGRRALDTGREVVGGVVVADRDGDINGLCWRRIQHQLVCQPIRVGA